MTAPAKATAHTKLFTFRSTRVAIRRRSLMRQNTRDDIAALIRGLVIIVLDFAIAARRNDWLRDSFFEPFSQRAAALVLVGDEFGGGCLRQDANLRDLAVVDASGCQKQDAGAARAIADAMEITVAAAFRAADVMANALFSALGAAEDQDAGTFDGQKLKRVGAAVSRKIHFAICEDSPRQLSRVKTRAKTLAPLREAGNVTALFGAAFAIARATKSH